MAVAGATNSKLNYNTLEKGRETMCTLFDEIAKEGEERGKKQGEAKQIVEMGQEFGLSELDILNHLQKKLDLSLKASKKYLKTFGQKAV